MTKDSDRRHFQDEGRRDEDYFNRRMLFLNSLLTEIGSTLDHRTILAKGVSGAASLLRACGGYVMTAEGGALSFPYICAPDDELAELSFDDNDENRRAFGFESAVTIDGEKGFAGQRERFWECGIQALLAIPLVSGKMSFGAMGVFSLDPDRKFSERDTELLKVLARGIAVALNNSILFDEVRDTQRQWQATFDCITDAIMIQNEDGVILRANQWAAQQAGTRPGEMVGRRTDELFPVPKSVKFDPFKKAMESGEPVSFETTSGGRDYIVSVFPVEYPRGTGRACVHVRKDMTEIKRLQAQLFNTEKLLAIGRLVSGVAHEINNPLTGVIGYAELLMRKSGGEGERELNKILESALRCKSIVENLLTFSRQRPQDRQCVVINSILDNTLDLRSYWFRQNRINIERHYGDVPVVMVASQQIQQVFLNIVENAEQAIKEAHGAEGGTITIETFHAGGRVLISFSDNGCGMAEDVVSKVFDPFFSTREVGQGVGLGLSSSYGIVKEHGGDLRIQSRLGEGSTVIIELPAAKIGM